MTAKHRRGKNNHKHEDNFFKNDLSDAEVGGGGNNYTLLLVLFLLIVVGGATGAWFCFQQHQTLTYLTDNLMGMQMKIVKLQSSQEELRRSNNKPVSESVETRLNALEESYALAQKQVGMALATAEQLKTSDLPAQVLSLHTEMKSRMLEMQQATVSLEQLGQLQSVLQGKSEEFDGVRIQVEGLATLTGQLSQKVDVLTGSLGDAESRLEERAGQVATLSANMDGQALEVLRLKHELSMYQAQLEASVKEMASVRELLEVEDSARLQQASVEQQLHTVRQSLLDQNSAAHNLHSELRAQLENIQQQAAQPEASEAQPPAKPVEEEKKEEEEVEEAAAAVVDEGLPAAAQETEEPEKAVPQDAAPVEQEEEEEDSPTEEEEAVTEVAASEAADSLEAGEPSVEEEVPEGEKVEEESPGGEEEEEVAEEEEDSTAGGELASEVEEEEEKEVEEDTAAEEEPQEEEESLDEDASPEELREPEWDFFSGHIHQEECELSQPNITVNTMTT